MTQPRLLGGRYELDGVIGRGGMAEVYRARDLRLDRQVAVKTLRSDLARDHIFQARFRREAQSAASLNHPSVIAVYDTGEDVSTSTPVPYIVMEYVEGHTLRDLLQEDRRLLPERAAEIVDGILHALDYSHRGGIVHRDIKPANVMLTRSGDVKVMDFGIARAMADTAATMTATAQVIGTAQYLSPEQARGERVDARSDIYSTGCVLYELLTGRPPFQGDSPVAIAYQHVREHPIPPSQLDPEIPHWADAITLKAMAKDANERYQNATEMRGDIQRALQGMPTAAATMAMPRTQTTAPTRMAPGYDLPPVQYDEEPRGDGKKVALWALLALAVLGGAVALALWLGGGEGGGDEVTVPANLVGKTEEAATTDLQGLGLKVETQQENSDEMRSGLVIRTDPEGGAQIEPSSTVTLIVSRGPERVEVPRVAGRSEDDARQRLEDAGFDVSVNRRSSNRADEGDAIGTRPSAGTRAAKGSQVTLYVSSGPSTAEVPNVVGLIADEAEKTLEDAGFEVNVTEIDDPSAPPGTVVRQSPEGGSSVAEGATVTIAVAREQDQGPPSPPSTPPTGLPTEDDGD